jgi:hypothetical protein
MQSTDSMMKSIKKCLVKFKSAYKKCLVKNKSALYFEGRNSTHISCNPITPAANLDDLIYI